MKNKTKDFFQLFTFALFAVICASCSSKLTSLSPSLFTVSPNPMEVKGTKIPVTVSGKFPEKWFKKNAEITLVPVLKGGGRELEGTPATYQGEKIMGNETTIYEKNGGLFNLNSIFDYDPNMVDPNLYIRFDASLGNKHIKMPDIKVAEGLLTTASLANVFTTDPAVAPDDFQKIIKDTYDANIHFLIQQAQLRSKELNSSDMDAWKQLVKSADNNPKQQVDVEIQAYASPDGGYKLNEKLAEQREKNTSEYVKKEFKKENIDAGVYANYTAQDWEGFKKLVEASSLPDKDLVLRVLSMYKDPAEREQEIKNISVVYKELAETILPQLRRSRLVANVKTIGKTDGELVAAANSNPSSLNVNELLYAATLNGTIPERIYTYVTEKYPNDYRGWNNLGASYFVAGKESEAKRTFEKARQVNQDAPEPSLNLGLFAIADGNMPEAEQLIGRSSGANTISEALGILYLTQGSYDKAVQAFGDTKSDNAALAQLLDKNYTQAAETLRSINNKTGITYYLEAIVAARTNDSVGVATHLQEAFNKDRALENYARNDIEFARLRDNSNISKLLR